ncbi:MAG: putative acetyltransferase [Sphingomonadales bacterium]|jgi:putative acetyltransferase|nr:putative acetyltransferase [Sphingomonadales bacterium]
MAEPFSIREERPGDRAAVRAVTEAAFGTGDEAGLVERLHADGDVEIALVAEEEGRIVGHVLFSRMAAPFRALGLGPVSVEPARQGSGIGSSLIGAGLARAREGRWDAVFVLGDPDYYGRFGFTLAAAAPFGCAYSGPHFMALPLGSEMPSGGDEIAYASAFAALG